MSRRESGGAGCKVEGQEKGGFAAFGRGIHGVLLAVDDIAVKRVFEVRAWIIFSVEACEVGFVFREEGFEINAAPGVQCPYPITQPFLAHVDPVLGVAALELRAGRIVLAHGAPLAFGEVGPPAFPILLAAIIFLEALLFGGHHVFNR